MTTYHFYNHNLILSKFQDKNIMEFLHLLYKTLKISMKSLFFITFEVLKSHILYIGLLSLSIVIKIFYGFKSL